MTLFITDGVDCLLSALLRTANQDEVCDEALVRGSGALPVLKAVGLRGERAKGDAAIQNPPIIPSMVQDY